jgi:hypothetical protein
MPKNVEPKNIGECKKMICVKTVLCRALHMVAEAATPTHARPRHSHAHVPF